MDTLDTHEISLRLLQDIPPLTLGQEVDTVLGKGIVIELKVPHAGQVFNPEEATATVYYSDINSSRKWNIVSLMWRNAESLT